MAGIALSPSFRKPPPRIDADLPPDQEFVNQDGQVFRWSALKGRCVVLAFFYSHCRDSRECATLSAKFAYMQHLLPPGSRLLEVTLDPLKDTPRVLRRYGAMFGQDRNYWTLATGNPLAIVTFARRLNVTIAVSPQGNGQLEHGEVLAIFDARQRLVSYNAGNDWQPEEALAEVRQTLGVPNSPFDRLKLWSRGLMATLENVAVACGRFLYSTDGRRLDPADVVTAPAVWPTPPALPPGAPPRIVTVWMNDTTVRPGKPWTGRIVASTNVASVEIRTESFSFTADRRDFGLFEFSQNVLDVIPQYHRPYDLRFIARNAAGVMDVRIVPITIH
ncbi:MAG TPA: SCO family protein [Candidatus Binatia bacterium]|nr:SCO family protein [Candidatus Binatia bacterium]